MLLFYLDNSRKIHPRGVRAYWPKDSKRRAPQPAGERERGREGERERRREGEGRKPEPAPARESPLAPLFICFSLPGPVLCKLGQPGVLLVLPEVLIPILGPSFVLFSPAFLVLIFQPLPFWTPFPYSNYQTRSHHLEKTIFNFSRTIDCI